MHLLPVSYLVWVPSNCDSSPISPSFVPPKQEKPMKPPDFRDLTAHELQTTQTTIPLDELTHTKYRNLKQLEAVSSQFNSQHV